MSATHCQSINFGISRNVFRETYFETKPFLIENVFATDGLGWGLIDSALDMQDPSPDCLKLLKGGRIEPERYLEEFIDIGIRRKRIAKHLLYQHLKEGGTVVLNRIELVSPQVRALCLSAGQFVGAQTTANAYAAFGPEPATNVHWDTHDVLVMQLKGRKRWRVYEPTHPLPVANQISNERKDELIDAPVMDLELEQGSCLYVPRGWWHKVEPVAGYDTIHLAVAIHVPLILDYLIWAAAHILPDLPEVRHGLLGRDVEDGFIQDAMSRMTEKLSCPETVRRFHARNQERERVVSPFNIAGLLQEQNAVEADGWVVVLNARATCQEDTEIMVNGSRCQLGGVHKRIIDKLREVGATPVSTLLLEANDMAREKILDALMEMALTDMIHVCR